MGYALVIFVGAFLMCLLVSLAAANLYNFVVVGRFLYQWKGIRDQATAATTTGAILLAASGAVFGGGMILLLLWLGLVVLELIAVWVFCAAIGMNKRRRMWLHAGMALAIVCFFAVPIGIVQTATYNQSSGAYIALLPFISWTVSLVMFLGFDVFNRNQITGCQTHPSLMPNTPLFGGSYPKEFKRELSSASVVIGTLTVTWLIVIALATGFLVVRH
jgi:hypothetical protein